MIVSDCLAEKLGADVVILERDRAGNERVLVPAERWLEVAEFLLSDARLQMNHFIDITAVDYPERTDAPRFDVILMVRSQVTGLRVSVRTRVNEDQKLPSLAKIWQGANWGEREIFDMFGIHFQGHPDLRRILMYDEFEGHPLRKDYPIDKAQPLVAYRKADDIEKLPPFGATEGQPWNRIDWLERLRNKDMPVSPSLSKLQQREK